MTTPEHTLVGVHFAFACGWHRRWGWRAVALAGIASNAPDWDGLPMLFDMLRFEGGHRVWGHNVFSALLFAAFFAVTQYYGDWLGMLGGWFSKFVRIERPVEAGEGPQKAQPLSLGALALIAFVVQMLHLPCDMVVSGGAGLPDWEVCPWWPFSKAAYVLPLIPWGDAGPTVVLMGGAFAAAMRPKHVRVVSCVTLAVLIMYLLARGWSRGVLS